MALESIEDKWTEFSTMIFRGVDITPTQVNEMKKAFFGGVVTAVEMFKGLGEPHVSEEEAVKYLENVEQECIEFKNQILKNTF